MTAARLSQQVTGTVDNNGDITLTFPPVPQGQTWTGSVALWSPLTQTASNWPLITALWSAQRNGQPLLAWSGEGIIYDVQLVGQEVLTITGVSLNPGVVVTALWTGVSEDASTATLVYPRVYGSQYSQMQVYTNGAPGDPLAVIPTPRPSSIQTATMFASAPGTYTMIPTTSATNSLWNMAINVSACDDATTTAAIPCLVNVQINGTNIWSLEPLVVQSSTVSVYGSLDFRGMYIPSNGTFTVVVGGFSGTSLRVNATAVYGLALV